MAITITDSPYEITPLGQKLIVVATSDNSSENGFQFKVTLSNTEGSIATKYIAPNPAGSLVFDVSQLVKLVNAEIIESVSVHSYTTIADEPEGYGEDLIDIDIEEAWIVDGVLEDDPDSEDAETITLNLWTARYQVKDGYKPNPSDRYALNHSTRQWLSSRAWNTHKPSAVVNQDLVSNKIFIPVREEDWGVLSIKRGLSGDEATQVQVTIFDSLGAPHGWSIDLGGSAPLLHIPLYPANLNATEESGWLHPSDYPGWQYIQIRAEDDGNIPVSVNYYLYNVDVFGNKDCRYDVIRLAWVGYGGGWEYFNFIKKSEFSDSFDRKRYRKIIGDYSAADFSASGMERGLTEREILADTFLVVNSDWIQENEFKFLRSLFASTQVHWVKDTGTHVPVVVEDSDYTQPNTRAGGLKNLTLKLRISSEYYDDGTVES